MRAAADAAGVPVWINGRTDLFVHADDPAAALGAVIERLHAMVAAGSNSVYPVAIHDNDELISAVVAAVDVPVNITAFPERHDLHRFVRLGVRRVTYGPFLQFALTEAMTSLLTPWRG